MSVIGKPVLFIATAKPAESRRFYESTLGLTCTSEDPYAIVFDLGVNTLRVQKVEALLTLNHTVMGWEVEDIQQSVGALSQSGVQFKLFEQLAQNDLGIWHSPSGASIAWFTDPDGNTLSLTQMP